MIVKDLKHTLHLILLGLEESLIKLRKIFTNSKKIEIEIEKEEWRRERERERDTYTFFLGLEISMEYHK